MNITKNSTLIFYILFILMIFSPIFGVAVVNSIALLIAITSIILCFFDQKILELYKNRYSFCFGLFFLFLILSSLNSDYYILSLKETIPFLFYLPFSIFFIYLISFNINLFLRFLYISLLIIFFILFIYFYLFLLYELVIIPINSKYSFIHKSSIISLLIIYFPLSPSLSFFNSWSNSLNFIVFSIFIFFTMRYHKN